MSLIAPLRWWPSWKMAAILKFQVAVGGLLSSDHQRLLMPIFMLVSPNKPLYHLTAPLRCRPSWKMKNLEISSGSDNFLVKWPMETAHANFHACIINWTIISLSRSTTGHDADYTYQRPKWQIWENWVMFDSACCTKCKKRPAKPFRNYKH